MKLAFPSGEQPDFAVGKGSFSIGNTAQDDIVIGGEITGHAILTLDQRGITLSVDDLPPHTVLVNERPVQRRAILRLGDRIRIGETEMVLRGEELNTATPPHAFEACQASSGLARVVLRGLAGQHAGQVFPILESVLIGSAPDADIRVAADRELRLTVGCAGERLFLRHEAGPEALDVNGHRVRHAELSPGDQLVFGGERLLVEAPGLVPGDIYTGQRAANGGQRAGNTQVFQAIPAAQAAAAGGDPSAEPASAPGADEEAFDASSGRWDTIIISVCAVLSVALLAWLYFAL